MPKVLEKRRGAAKPEFPKAKIEFEPFHAGQEPAVHPIKGLALDGLDL